MNEHKRWTASRSGTGKGLAQTRSEASDISTAPVGPARPGVHGVAGPSCRSWESLTERHIMDTIRRTWPRRQGCFLPWSFAQNQALLGTTTGRKGSGSNAGEKMQETPKLESPPSFLAGEQASRYRDSTACAFSLDQPLLFLGREEQAGEPGVHRPLCPTCRRRAQRQESREGV